METRFYKTISNGYITSIGRGFGGIEIEEPEYLELENIINNKPTPPYGYDYMLRTDLTWELAELPPEPSPEATAEDFRGSLSEMGVNV